MKAEQVILKYGGDILSSELVKQSKNCIQHGDISVYTHCFMVAKYALLMSKRLNVECSLKTLVRGALLHDFFMYDWHWAKMPEEMKKLGLHGFTHPVTAAKNARKYFNVTQKEYDMIICHMFPLTITRVPRSKEGWLLCGADKWCSLLETLRIQPYDNAYVDRLTERL